MLVECGYVRAVDGEGREWSFLPSFARIATLGSPEEIVQLYVDLHGPGAARAARYVLACLCEQEDPTPLLGDVVPAEGGGLQYLPGGMPDSEQVIVARHLMQHGICGTAKPGEGGGQYSPRFDAAEFIAAGRVHLGLSSADAEALSMTELQGMMAMKFPDDKSRPRDVPDRATYDAAMARLKEKRGG